MSDETEASESQGAEPEATSEPDAAAAPEGGAVAIATEDAPSETALAVPDEVGVPAVVAAGPTVDPKVEQRKSRLWLPLLIPLGAIAVVALFALNISRVFLVASEGDSTPAVIIAAGITVTILLGATVIAAIPNIRTSSLIVGLAGVMLFVLLAGSLVLGASLPKSEAAAGYVEPAGKAINTLEVDALPELKFQAKKFDVPAGINLVKYNDKGGTHTLVFDSTATPVPGFQLSVPVGKNAAKVDFVQGKTYTVYCTLPGHRAAGMEADIVVGPPGGTPEAGTQNPTVTTVPAGTPPSTVKGGSSNTDPASQSSTGS
jgi:plastocyanin